MNGNTQKMNPDAQREAAMFQAAAQPTGANRVIIEQKDNMQTKYPTLITVAAGVFFALVATCAPAQEWTQTTAPSTNWSALASSADGSKLIATARGSFTENVPIYISTNAGVTWQESTPPLTNYDWSSVASSADGGRLVASSRAGVYTSTNFGADWVYQTNHFFGSLASSADGTRLVGAESYHVFTSADAGVSWQPSGVDGGECVASSADGTKLVTAYFAYPGQLFGGIFTSTNAGFNWTRTSAPLDYWTGWTALASSADGVKLAATIGPTGWPTGPGPIFVSTNGGGTWQASGSLTSFWFSVASSADGATLVASGSTGTYTSADAGKNWGWVTNVPPGLNGRAYVSCSADGKTLAVALAGGGIWISRTTPTPSLNLARAGTNVVASWTVPSLDFVLQQNPNLSETNWTDVPIPPVLNLTNLQQEVLVPKVGTRFFRLKH